MKSTSVTPTCCLCGKPISLETCKIDEYGQAMHEECAVARLTSHKLLAAFPERNVSGRPNN